MHDDDEQNKIMYNLRGFDNKEICMWNMYRIGM